MPTPAKAGDETRNCVMPTNLKESVNLENFFWALFAEPRYQKPGTGPAPGQNKTKPQPKSDSSQAALLEERRARLRTLFVATARGFIGVPYARKHHDPQYCTCEGCSTSGRQLYHSPLFLDCCGLVRRVVRDLRAHLGFRLGPGNQAYQYDTLPIRPDSVEQLKPGDLVFYSGTYFDPLMRRQIFDMTHVEIFVGGCTGEATIGSRERYKWVMEYDSYRFVSQRWKLTACHFCSIDPWLDGMCVPQNPELWRPRQRAKHKHTHTHDRGHRADEEQDQQLTSTTSPSGV